MKFCKIIRPSDVENSDLKLPEKFEKRFKDKLPGLVTLDVPSGVQWRVEVEKNDDGVWLKGKGWAEFVDNLGLETGHFLMFELEELRDVFHVVVMDIDASEIKYPNPVIDEDPVNVGDGDENKDDDLVFVSATHHPVRKRVRRRHDKETILDNNGRIQCVVQGRKICTDAISEEAEQALARAKTFKATEPVFIVALQPSYLSRTPERGNNSNCQLLVPRNFIEAFFDMAIKSVILETRDEMSWHVLYLLSGGTYRFTGGWKQFAEDNQLITGDACLFELNREAPAPNALKVSIFRTTGADEILL